ncbi:MAG: alpha/beta hydrolase [Candidatus Marinimicrobia bacterium]|nr:alpha/beta hydrolase [Candidatus Neomarinimicrobiota bacterium]
MKLLFILMMGVINTLICQDNTHISEMNITVQNVNIFSKSSGEGTPILFLHGVPDTHDIWNPIVAELESNYRCITPDWPGFGQSDSGETIDCSLDGHADFVNDLADALGLTEPFYLVAHDFGGISAMAFASKYPDRVRRLVISNAPFSPDYNWHFMAKIWKTPLLGEFSMLTMNSIAFSISMQQGSEKLSKAHIKEMYSQLSSNMRKMILKMYRGMPEDSFKDWQPKFLIATSQIPTLILWGEKDPYLPTWLAKSYGAEEVKYYPDSGHWAPAEEPTAFTQDLKRFLK